MRCTAAWAVLIVVAALAAGCVSTSPQSASQPAPRAPEVAPQAGAGRDLVTTSDEGETAKRGRLRLELAAAYFAEGKAATALDEVKQSLAVNPNQSAAHNLRGLIYASLNEHALAEESYRRALQINAGDADALHNYGWFLCQRRRFPEANAQFGAALAVPNYREQGKTLLTQGVCQARAGQMPAAEQTLTRSFEVDPGNPATAMNLADVLYRRGEFERARFYVRRVNATPGLSNAESLWLASRIEYRLGNRAGANDFGEQLRARFPGTREANQFERGQFSE
jgi:type IV pilus assembly protein PilF